MRLLIPSAMALALTGAAAAEPQMPSPSITQLFTYRLTDAARFHAGYRSHLGWHARQRDRLAWYAWTVQSGPRRGLFIDGTAGASWTDLDLRPDPAGDRADFAATAGPHAQAIDVETWELWPAASTATPLESRTPSAAVDAFFLATAPGSEARLERAIGRLVRGGRNPAARLAWYRKLRGGTTPVYMILASRERWADIGTTGTLPRLLAHAYRTSEARAQAALRHATSVSVETWRYEPGLSLFPRSPLAP